MSEKFKRLDNTAGAKAIDNAAEAGAEAAEAPEGDVLRPDV
jgi:hypothetical protein